MKYNLILYNSGKYQKEIEVTAKTYESAVGAYKHHYDVVVIGKKVKRWVKGHEFKVVDCKIFKYDIADTHGILLMIDNLSEMYNIDDKQKRNEAYVKCEELMFARYANQNERLMDITVFLNEIRTSKNISTDLKTSKGYVAPVTKKVTFPQWFTEESSGRVDAVDSAGYTWKVGSKASLSKPNRTFSAKVKKLPEGGKLGDMSISSEMYKLQGYMIEVKAENTVNGWKWFGHGWYWLDEMLEFNVMATVIQPEREVATGGGHTDYFAPHMSKYVGKRLEFKPVEKEGWYTSVDYGFNWHKSWLFNIVPVWYKEKPSAKFTDEFKFPTLELKQESKDVYAKVVKDNGEFVPMMEEMMGKIYKFQKDGMLYKAKGFSFYPESIKILKNVYRFAKVTKKAVEYCIPESQVGKILVFKYIGEDVWTSPKYGFSYPSEVLDFGKGQYDNMESSREEDSRPSRRRTGSGDGETKGELSGHKTPSLLDRSEASKGTAGVDSGSDGAGKGFVFNDKIWNPLGYSAWKKSAISGVVINTATS